MINFILKGFNPYSTGFSSFIILTSYMMNAIMLSFNPYSTGFSSFIKNKN